MKKYILLFIFFLVCGCASKSEVDSLKQQIVFLSGEQKKIIKEYKIELEKTKKDFQKRLLNSNFSARSFHADIVSRIEALRINIAKLEGGYDSLKKELTDEKNATISLKSKIAFLETSIKNIEKDLKKLKLLLGVSNKVTSTSISNKFRTQSKGNIQQHKNIKHDKSSKRQKLEISPEKLYSQALSNFKKGNYYTSSHLFSLFINKFSKHRLIPNAYFWRGECFYKLKQYPKAILNYQKVLDKYPTSNKYRPSLLKEGISFFKIGKKKAGRILLEDLIKNFPTSKEAKSARRFLRNSS